MIMHMAVIDERERFTFPRKMSAGMARHMKKRCYSVEAEKCRAAGDMEGYARWTKEADEPLSLSAGPPIAIAERRRP
jgi:hypothetical protein